MLIRDGTIHIPPDSILSRYLGADTIRIAIYFKNLIFLIFKYCDLILLCCDFIFFSLDHGKKLNNTRNMQTFTIIIIKNTS